MKMDERRSEAQLLRIPYISTATDDSREFLVYLPIGYDTEKDKRWPVILSLHGGGARGDGTEDLDHVMRNGPLFEAWTRHRDLPFVMIGPQLPVLGMENQLQLRGRRPKTCPLGFRPGATSSCSSTKPANGACSRSHPKRFRCDGSLGR